MSSSASSTSSSFRAATGRAATGFVRRVAGFLVLALVLAAPIGCGSDPGSPTAVAQRFVLAAQRGDTAALLPLLERRAAQRLQSAAERATHHVGGRRTIAPHEMLQLVDVDPTLRITTIELDGEVLAEDGAIARVRVVGGRGEAIDLSLIHEDGAWRVQVPAPDPGASSAEPGPAPTGPAVLSPSMPAPPPPALPPPATQPARPESPP